MRFGFPETPSSSSKQEQDDEKQEGQPVSHYFLATMADGTTHKLHAWLYVSTEQQSVPPPVIVMASVSVWVGCSGKDGVVRMSVVG